jgi:hypothetical protein
MTDENSSDDVIVGQEGANPEQEEAGGDVIAGVDSSTAEKEHDNYYKNKAFELERKNNRMAEELTEIKDILKSQQKSQTADNQYSESQLQAALSSDTLTPEQRSFAQAELQKIQDRKFEEREQRIISEMEKRQKEQLTRQQAEQQLLTDPRFQEAFIKLPNGTVQWKQDSELAQTIGAYMQDSALSQRPDGTLVAAKLAYADITANRGQQEQQKLKRQNEQLKSQTMVEGGGKQYNKPTEDPYSDAMGRLKQGDKYAGTVAVKEFLRRRGAFKQ